MTSGSYSHTWFPHVKVKGITVPTCGVVEGHRLSFAYPIVSIHYVLASS